MRGSQSPRPDLTVGVAASGDGMRARAKRRISREVTRLAGRAKREGEGVIESCRQREGAAKRKEERRGLSRRGSQVKLSRSEVERSRSRSKLLWVAGGVLGVNTGDRIR